MGQLIAKFKNWQVDLSQPSWKSVYRPCSSGLLSWTTITFYFVGYNILGYTAHGLFLYGPQICVFLIFLYSSISIYLSINQSIYLSYFLSSYFLMYFLSEGRRPFSRGFIEGLLTKKSLEASKHSFITPINVCGGHTMS